MTLNLRKLTISKFNYLEEAFPPFLLFSPEFYSTYPGSHKNEMKTVNLISFTSFMLLYKPT